MGLAAIVLCSGVARGDHFHNPPELDVPGWVTPFPYQRNIMIGFDTDPHTWPDHITSPVPGAHKALTPLVVHHEGTDDHQLYPSDWLGGEVEPAQAGYTEWLATDTETGTNREGILAFYAEQPGTFTLTWHIDNWDRPREFKNYYVEIEYFSTGNSGLDQLVSSTGQIEPLPPHNQGLANGWVRWRSWATLEPNPVYEEMVNIVTFDATQIPGMLLIDYVHIGTECVPEPGSAVFMVCGVLAVLRRRARK